VPAQGALVAAASSSPTPTVSLWPGCVCCAGGVLVHCAAGVSRSATVVLGYLMARRGMSATDACTYLRTKRPWVNPNHGFRAQLEAFELLGCDTSKWRAWRHVWREPLQPGAVVDVRNVLSTAPPAAAPPADGEGHGKASSSPRECLHAGAYPCPTPANHEVPHLPAAAAAAAAIAAEQGAQQHGRLEPLAAAATGGPGAATATAVVVASRSRYGSAAFGAATDPSSSGQVEVQSAPCCNSLGAAVAAEALQQQQRQQELAPGSAPVTGCGFSSQPMPWPSAASKSSLSSSSSHHSLSCPLPSPHTFGPLPSSAYTAPLQANGGARLQGMAPAHPQHQPRQQEGQVLGPGQLLPLLHQQQAQEGRLGPAPPQGGQRVQPLENVMGLGI
jgi:hypothetical protein